MSTQALSESEWKWRAPLLCAGVTVALYQLLLKYAPALTDAEPSYAGEIFPWVKVVTKGGLRHAQEQPGNPAMLASFLAVCAALFVVYAVMMRAVKGRQTLRGEAFLFGAGALFQILYLLSPIMLSSDLYAYVVYGREMSVYGGNPYVDSPVIVDHADPFMPLFGGWIPSWYGPLWTWLCAGLAWLTGNNVGLTVLVFRALAIAATLATGGLLWAILRRTEPERAAQGLVFFLWNPLVVIEIGMSGHNDGFMLVFLMFGFWLHLRGWKAGAVLAITVSAMLKFVTGMLVPLYMLMVLRQTADWRARGMFTARAVLLAGAALGLVRLFGHEDTGSATAHSAFSPDFYQNNFHEIAFKALRRSFGEDVESVKLRSSFEGWWVAAKAATELRAETSRDSAGLRQLPAGAALLALAPDTAEWLRVFDPVSKRKGYVDGTAVDVAARPAGTDDDAIARELEKPLVERATVRRANVIVRIVTWLLFAAFGLLAAWRASDFPRFLTWSAAAMLASYYCIITEIRPWYVLWALAIAAVAPSRIPARLAVLLSGGALTLYFSLSYEGGDPAWIGAYRSIPAFIVPLVIFAFTLRRTPTDTHETAA